MVAPLSPLPQCTGDRKVDGGLADKPWRRRRLPGNQQRPRDAPPPWSRKNVNGGKGLTPRSGRQSRAEEEKYSAKPQSLPLVERSNDGVKDLLAVSDDTFLPAEPCSAVVPVSTELVRATEPILVESLPSHTPRPAQLSPLQTPKTLENLAAGTPAPTQCWTVGRSTAPQTRLSPIARKFKKEVIQTLPAWSVRPHASGCIDPTLRNSSPRAHPATDRWKPLLPVETTAQPATKRWKLLLPVETTGKVNSTYETPMTSAELDPILPHAAKILSLRSNSVGTSESTADPVNAIEDVSATEDVSASSEICTLGATAESSEKLALSNVSSLADLRREWDPALWCSVRDDLLQISQFKEIHSLWRSVREGTERAVKRRSYLVSEKVIQLKGSPSTHWFGEANAGRFLPAEPEDGTIQPPLLVSNASPLDVAVSLQRRVGAQRQVFLVAELHDFDACGAADLNRPAGTSPACLPLRSDFGSFVKDAMVRLRGSGATVRSHLCAAHDPYIFYCKHVNVFRGPRDQGYPFLREPTSIHVLATSAVDQRPDVVKRPGKCKPTEWYADENTHHALLDRLQLIGMVALELAQIATEIKAEDDLMGETPREDERPILVFGTLGCGGGRAGHHPRNAVAHALQGWRQAFGGLFHSVFACCGSGGGFGDAKLASLFDGVINRDLYSVRIADRTYMEPWHWDPWILGLANNPNKLEQKHALFDPALRSSAELCHRATILQRAVSAFVGGDADSKPLAIEDDDLSATQEPEDWQKQKASKIECYQQELVGSTVDALEFESRGCSSERLSRECSPGSRGRLLHNTTDKSNLQRSENNSASENASTLLNKERRSSLTVEDIGNLRSSSIRSFEEEVASQTDPRVSNRQSISSPMCPSSRGGESQTASRVGSRRPSATSVYQPRGSGGNERRGSFMASARRPSIGGRRPSILGRRPSIMAPTLRRPTQGQDNLLAAAQLATALFEESKAEEGEHASSTSESSGLLDSEDEEAKSNAESDNSSEKKKSTAVRFHAHEFAEKPVDMELLRRSSLEKLKQKVAAEETRMMRRRSTLHDILGAGVAVIAHGNDDGPVSAIASQAGHALPSSQEAHRHATHETRTRRLLREKLRKKRRDFEHRCRGPGSFLFSAVGDDDDEDFERFPHMLSQSEQLASGRRMSSFEGLNKEFMLRN